MAKLTVWQNGIRQDAFFEGAPLLSAVLVDMGLAVQQPCGGRGRCHKCLVKLEGMVSPPNAHEQQAGGRLACQAVLLGDCQAVLPSSQEMAQIQVDGQRVAGVLNPMSGPVGAAADIGTTTLALKLYDLKTGALLASAVRSNPQAAVAADVMGRIGAALQGALPRLQQMATDALERMLQDACQRANVPESDVQSLVVTGNTTMLYLLTGRSPLSLSRAPFQADHLFGEWIDLLGKRAYLPPCINAFVGADITCAVLSSNLCATPQAALLADVGTNGEIALWKEGVLHVTSTAAGPAFEGAGIHMGCGSIPGAIDSVWMEDGALTVHTIGEKPAVGVCGSGLVDAIAVLLQQGAIEETGAANSPRFDLANGVYLLPGDVRNVQLAKAAIAAGIRTLMHTANTRPQDLKVMYLAGGFGSHLDIASAVRIGLIPEELETKVRVIGNASLTGAAELLLNTERMEDLHQIVQCARHAELGGNPWFNEAYMEEMLFPGGG
ncbi:MAG: DUF4445 domain-containing protein [Clostridiales bacterium]|nr:DUF4445 domain-containing protein [Clostridiales bacterium]